MPPVILPVSLIVSAYVIGSIPFSYLVVRAVAGADIRQHGSRNVGATNVARTAGKAPGIAALLLDLAKGYAAVALARLIVAQAGWPFVGTTGRPIDSRELWIAAAALIAVFAHMFPAWLRFHGGKGVATTAGAFLGLEPVVIVGAAIVFLIALLVTRYVSLASVLSAAAIPLFMRFLVEDAPFWRVVVSILIVLAVIGKHQSNIARLAQGTEHKLGERKERS